MSTGTTGQRLTFYLGSHGWPRYSKLGNHHECQSSLVPEIDALFHNRHCLESDEGQTAEESEL